MFCVCSVVALRLDEPPGMKIFWSEIRVELPPVPIHLPGCRSPVCCKDFLLTCPAISVDDQLTVSTSCSAHRSVYAHALTVLITAALLGWGSFKSHGVSSLAWIFSKVILTIQLGVSMCVCTPVCVRFSTYVCLNILGFRLELPRMYWVDLERTNVFMVFNLLIHKHSILFYLGFLKSQHCSVFLVY